MAAAGEEPVASDEHDNLLGRIRPGPTADHAGAGEWGRGRCPVRNRVPSTLTYNIVFQAESVTGHHNHLFRRKILNSVMQQISITHMVSG
ncbi:hypothetical protein GCM10009854_04740 [Saccharopolyspora halophila]|uniref:Uncharacterized protein n=1 Tax=Saccharopolyspora halophila TaxID=405551 RepID=A0ABN3FLE7_9PSEU